MSDPIDNRIGPNFGKPISERHPLRECICGADIRQEMGTDDWFNQDDRQGTSLYCYPDTKGPDGMARHEPWEDSTKHEEWCNIYKNIGGCSCTRRDSE